MGLFDRLVSNLVDNGVESLKRTVSKAITDATDNPWA